VTETGDYESDMPPTGLLDDETIDAIVAGDEVDARFDQIVAFARHVRSLGDEPLPPASPALEAVFAGLDDADADHGDYADDAVVTTIDARRRRRRFAGAVAKVAGLGLAAQVGLGASVAAAGVVAAGAGGVLPGPATNGVRSAIEAVTPIDFGGSGASDEPARRDDPDRFGDRVSTDATGESDGSPGVDGGEISDEAPGAAHRPGAPGTTDNRGLDRAGETPAAPHVPEQSGGSGGSGDNNDDTEDTDDPPSGVDDTPGATAPGATAPGQTVQDPEASPSSTIPPSAPAGTATGGNAGGGGNSAAQGG
jgi:hypothetical protein